MLPAILSLVAIGPFDRVMNGRFRRLFQCQKLGLPERPDVTGFFFSLGDFLLKFFLISILKRSALDCKRCWQFIWQNTFVFLSLVKTLFKMFQKHYCLKKLSQGAFGFNTKTEWQMKADPISGNESRPCHWKCYDSLNIQLLAFVVVAQEGRILYLLELNFLVIHLICTNKSYRSIP